MYIVNLNFSDNHAFSDSTQNFNNHNIPPQKSSAGRDLLFLFYLLCWSAGGQETSALLSELALI